MKKTMKPSNRPKRIDFYLQDPFTKESRLILSSPYNAVQDGLNGKVRRLVKRIVSVHHEMRLLNEHDPNKFPSTKLTLRIAPRFGDGNWVSFYKNYVPMSF